MDFVKTLDTLLDWKKLPAYRVEPRVDFIIAGALLEIIKAKFKEDVKIIIPELPIRIGSIYPHLKTNKSYKVDFYVLLKSGKNLFIEFKTDSKSRRGKQDKYLLAAKNSGMKNIVDGIIKIYEATTYKKKYAHLLDKLISISLISLKNGVFKDTVNRNSIEIVYIQPQSKNQNDIGFEEVAKIMGKSRDKIYKHFGKILETWAFD